MANQQPLGPLGPDVAVTHIASCETQTATS